MRTRKIEEIVRFTSASGTDGSGAFRRRSRADGRERIERCWPGPAPQGARGAVRQEIWTHDPSGGTIRLAAAPASGSSSQIGMHSPWLPVIEEHSGKLR